MIVPTRFAKRFEKLADSTGVDAETYLTMALKDWFEVCAPTFRSSTKVVPASVCKISKFNSAPVLLTLVPLSQSL